MKRKWRLYLDTSVFGGCFDAEEGWSEDSRRVIDYCRDGKALLIWSDVLEKEISLAPDSVKSVYAEISLENRERVELDQNVRILAESYLAAGVVGAKWYEDCIHVAAATLAMADAVVSWNFRHIVRLDRIRAFNSVNLAEGYGVITILSPKEVNLDE